MDEDENSDEEEESPGTFFDNTFDSNYIDSSHRTAYVVKSTVGKMPEESAFKGAGQTHGIEIWRIEKMIPVALPKKDYGIFANEDSYIVLGTEDRPEGTVWNIFYWLVRTPNKYN